jgi:hypothetical protein
MHKNATKCNKTLSKWCKNKHGASKIIDTFETYQTDMASILFAIYKDVYFIEPEFYEPIDEKQF